MRGFALYDATGSIAFTSLYNMAAALAAQQVEVGDYWQCGALPVAAIKTPNDCPEGYVLGTITETLPVRGALAYHDEDDAGRPRMSIGWELVRANGGDLTGPTGLLTTISHEMCETRVNPYAAFLVDNPIGGFTTPLEICDWVQGSSYEIAQGLYVSDFVGPRAFDALARVGPFNRMGTLTRAFQLDPAGGGYWSKRFGGPGAPWEMVFGERMPAHVRASKGLAGSRLAHILRRHPAYATSTVA